MGASYDAGVAIAKYELDLAPLRRSVAEAKRLYADMAKASGGTGAGGSQPTAKAPVAGGVGGSADAAAQAARAESATARYALTLARLQKAQNDNAGAIATYRTALQSLTPNTLEAIRVQTALEGTLRKVDNAGGVLPRTIAGLSHEAAQFAVQSLAAGGAIGVLTTAFNSFADAFKFKAELDATKSSINVLLQGVRDSGQVWASGQAYAQRYKLTQEELTTAINASTMIMRSSKAPTEQILNTMQRLTVLNPRENIEGAAFALKELQSGDINSLAERFNISRVAANKMKAEILAGGDAVVILDRYLQGIGVTSEALSAKLDGPIGKMKDLALQQEALKLAQSDFAMGPGLKILELQTNATRGATRLFSADWAAMGQSLGQNADYLARVNPELGRIAAATGILAQSSRQSADAQAAQAAAATEQIARNNESAAAAFGVVNASNAQRLALQQATEAANADALAKLTDAANADLLKTKNAELEAAIRAAAAGSGSAASAAANLAAVYEGVNIPALIKLIGLLREKAALEGAAAMDTATASYRAGERDTAEGERVAERRRRELARAATEARRDQLVSTGTATQAVAVRQQQYNEAVAQFGANSEQAIKAETALIQARQRLASEGAKGAKSIAKDARDISKAYETEYQAARDTAQRIEEIQRSHYDKLRQLSEDYQLSQSRRNEDYEEKRRRLLAEGKRAEAAQLQKEHEKDSRRAAEDAAIARRRENEQAGQSIAEARQKAAQDAGDRARQRQISGDALPGDAAAIAAAKGATAAAAPSAAAYAPAVAAQAQAALAASAALAPRGGPMTVRVEFAPISLQVDGRTVASVTYPYIEQRLVEDLTVVSAAAPVAASIAGGGRP